MTASGNNGGAPRSDDLRSLIPHRYPFLFLDRILAVDPGRTGTAIKNVTANDTQLVGHFPSKPIMPGVLIVEACAQLAAVVIASDRPGTEPAPAGDRAEEAIGMLALINQFKFVRPVRPGDSLLLAVRIGKRFQHLCQVSADVSCNRRAVASGSIAVSLPTAQLM